MHAIISHNSVNFALICMQFAHFCATTICLSPPPPPHTHSRLSILIKYHRMFAVKMSTFSSLIQRISALAPEIAALEAKGYTEGEVSHYNWVGVAYGTN